MLTPSSITIWNASTGTKVSKFTFTETIVAFVFNPFQPENLVCKSVIEYCIEVFYFFLFASALA